MSSLLDELGLDESDFVWQNLALCQGTDTETYFDKYEKDEEVAKAADQICLHCPVISQCFYKGAAGETGLWGGIYWNGSGKPDRNKNAHKTPEVWAEIQVKVAAGGD